MDPNELAKEKDLLSFQEKPAESLEESKERMKQATLVREGEIKGVKDAPVIDQVEIRRESGDLLVSLPQYNFVIINIANTNNRPKAEKAAFRILGFFETKEEAFSTFKEWVSKHNWIANDCAIHLLPVSKWVALCTNWDDQCNSEYCLKHIEDCLDRNYANLEKNKKEFKEILESKKFGDISQTRKEELAAELKAKSEKNTRDKDKKKLNQKEMGKLARRQMERKKALENPNTIKAKTWPQDCEIRGQKVAVISTLLDNHPTILNKTVLGTQDLIRIYAPFENDESADAWKENTASKVVIHYDLDTIDMYEWKTPQGVNPKTVKQEKFRNKALDTIMHQSLVTEKQKLEEFDQWCAQDGKDKPEVTVKSSGVVHKSEAGKKDAIDFVGDSGKYTIDPDTGAVKKEGEKEGESPQEFESISTERPTISMQDRSTLDHPELNVDLNAPPSLSQQKKDRRAQRLQK